MLSSFDGVSAVEGIRSRIAVNGGTRMGGLAPFLAAVMAVFVGCAAETGGVGPVRAVSAGQAALPDSDVAVRLQVDSRIEIISILQRLAGAREYSAAVPGPYARAVDEYFSRFRDHPAVVRTEKLRREHGIVFDAPMNLAVQLDPTTFAPLVPLSPRPANLDERFEGVDLELYLTEIRAFAAETRFERFFRDQAAYFEAVESRLRDLLESQISARKWLDAYLDRSSGARIRIVPGLLTGPSSYAARRQPERGSQETYQVVSLENPDSNGLPRPTSASRATAVHELGHSYVNPLISELPADHRSELERAYAWVDTSMQGLAYTNTLTMLRETAVRALVAEYTRSSEPDAVRRLVDEDLESGFVWLPWVLDKLASARSSCEGDCSLGDQVAAGIASWLDESPDGPVPPRFRGPILAAFSPLRVRYVPWIVVVPAAGVAPELRDYVDGTSGKFFPGSPRVEPTELPVPVQERMIASYGAPSSNPLSRRWLEELGWAVEEGYIRVDGQEFSGPGLVLIAACEPPDRSAHALLLYSAADDRDLIGVHAVPLGAADWVVARRVEGAEQFEVLAHGNLDSMPAVRSSQAAGPGWRGLS